MLGGGGVVMSPGCGVVMSPGGGVVMSPGVGVMSPGGWGAVLWAQCGARWAGTSSWEAAQGALSCPPSAAWPGLLVGAGLGLLTLALCDPA